MSDYITNLFLSSLSFRVHLNPTPLRDSLSAFNLARQLA
nr:MAG TPA: hypothetical protein [Caudoviricetes sp.]